MRRCSSALGQAHASLDRVLGMVGHHDHRMVVEKGLRAAAGVHQPVERAIGLGYRMGLLGRARTMRVGVVVGQREEQEVEQVVLHQVRSHTTGVAVALAGHAERGEAAGALRVEDVGVEELARAPHRMAELRRLGKPAVGRVGGRLVAVAAAVDQVGGARGAQAGVVEVLEHGAPVLGQVRMVHVVDGVHQRPEDAEGAGGREGAAVLHVALLAAVDTSSSRGSATLRAPGPVAMADAATGVIDGKVETQSSTYTPRSMIAVEGWGAALGHRLLEGLGVESVDHRQDHLGGPAHLRIRRPAYLRSPWPRPRTSSTAKAARAPGRRRAARRSRSPPAPAPQRRRRR